MNTWAAPGVQCVCVNDDFSGWTFNGFILPVRQPMANELLTITEVFSKDGAVYLRFEEIPQDQNDGPFQVFGIGWPITAFRPLEKRKTDISVFLKMLMPNARIHADA